MFGDYKNIYIYILMWRKSLYVKFYYIFIYIYINPKNILEFYS
jgi:hypothetical protein